MTFPVQVGPASITINRDDRFLVCQPDGRILGSAEDGFLRLIAILCGIHATTDRSGSRIYVNPALPDWLPALTIRNLRAGAGSLDLALDDGQVEVLANTTGFEVIHAPAPRPSMEALPAR